MTFTAREEALLTNTDVLGYIQAQNAERNAQAVAEGWQFWTLMAESLADEHANAYELEHRLAWGTYSDVYKEAYFSRPHIDLSSWTLSEIEASIEQICESEQRAAEMEAEWQAEQEKLDREEITLGLAEPTEEVELEEWEIYEAKAEAAGY
jgi:hypothetical protein